MRKDLPVLAVGKLSFDFRSQTGGGVDISLVGDSMDQLRDLAPTVVERAVASVDAEGRAHREGQRRSRSGHAGRSHPREELRLRCAVGRELHPDCAARHAAQGFPRGRPPAAGVAALPGRRYAEPGRPVRFQIARAGRHADSAALADARRRARHADRDPARRSHDRAQDHREPRRRQDDARGARRDHEGDELVRAAARLSLELRRGLRPRSRTPARRCCSTR